MPSPPHLPIVILGGGNMGGALAVRWHKSSIAPVHVVEHNPTRVQLMKSYGLNVHAELEDVPSMTSAFVVAIKPQQFEKMKERIAASPAAQPMLISIMAGVSLATLKECSKRAVRVMPNLPVMVGEGMNVACGPGVEHHVRLYVSELFEEVGKCRWVEDEVQLQTATAISGSGPGYLFMFMETLEKAAMQHGLDADTSRQLVMQMVFGSGLLASESAESFAALRQQVTSPGGTTEAALKEFTKFGFHRMVEQGVSAAIARSVELGNG